jgi:hypothetical protein
MSLLNRKRVYDLKTNIYVFSDLEKKYAYSKNTNENSADEIRQDLEFIFRVPIRNAMIKNGQD